MRHILRSFVALCLLGSVAGFAALQEYSVTITPNLRLSNYPIVTLQAGGVNGQFKGKGTLQLTKTFSYPVTVTAGAITSTATGTTVLTTRTVTLAGTVKPRTGAAVPFTLTADDSGIVEMTITGGSVIDNFGQVKIKP